MCNDQSSLVVDRDKVMAGASINGGDEFIGNTAKFGRVGRFRGVTGVDGCGVGNRSIGIGQSNRPNVARDHRVIQQHRDGRCGCAVGCGVVCVFQDVKVGGKGVRTAEGKCIV